MTHPGNVGTDFVPRAVVTPRLIEVSSAAEEGGFEPPVPCGTAVFKTAAFDHSATPPSWSGPFPVWRCQRATPEVTPVRLEVKEFHLVYDGPMAHRKPILADFATWAARLSIDDIPPRVLEKLRLQIASALSAAAASPWHNPSQAVLRAMTSEGQSMVFATGDRRSPEQAAFTNAAFAMALDFDDYMLSGHTSHSAIFVPLAFANTLDDVLLSAAVANEFMGRLSTACLLGPVNGQMSSYIHNAGAAVALGKLFGLDAPSLASAVALALYQPNHCLAAGFWNEDSKTITASQPLAQGIRAAQLARAGLRGPDDLVEHRLGFLSTFAFEPYPGLFDDIGAQWFSETLCYKRFPGTSYISAAVEAALQCAQHTALRSHEVDSIRIHTTLLSSTVDSLGAAAIDREPLDANAINFSVRLSVAAALRFGELSPKLLQPDNILAHQDEIRSIAHNVSVVHDWAMTIDMMSASPLGIRMLAGLSPSAAIRSITHARRLNRTSGSAGRNRSSWQGVASRLPRLRDALRGPVSARGFDASTFRMLQSARVHARFEGRDQTAFVAIPMGACGRDHDETRNVLRWRCEQAFGSRATTVWDTIFTPGATVAALEDACMS